MATEQEANGAEAGGEGAKDVPETSEPQTISLEEHNRILGEYRAAAKAELDTKDTTYGQESQTWGQEKKKLRGELAHFKSLAEEAALPDDRLAIVQRRREAEALFEDYTQGMTEVRRLRAEAAADIATDKLKARFPGLSDHFYGQARTRMMRGPLETQDAMLEAEQAFKALPANKGKSESASGSAKEPTGPALPVGRGSTSSGLTSYKQALKNGAKLPSASEIDAATAEFLSKQRG